MRTLLIAVLLLFGSTSYGQHDSGEEDFEHYCFLPARSWSLGVGVPYSFHAESIGFNSRLYYNMGHAFCFGPEFSYFKTEELQILDFDFLAHYIFETPISGVYPLFGVNYTMEEEHGHSEGALGVVFGGGLHRNFSSLTVFAEYAHVQSELADDFVTLGVMYTFH